MQKSAAFLAMVASFATPVSADDRSGLVHPYTPRLGDIMEATQLRHF